MKPITIRPTKYIILAISSLIPPIIFLWLPQYFFGKFQSYQIYASFPANNSDKVLEQQFTSLLNYLKPFSQGELDRKFFSYEDIVHMQDVKNLYIGLYIFILFLTIVLIIMKIYRSDTVQVRVTKFLYNSISTVAAITAVTLVTALSLIFFNFPLVFERFHQLFFNNNYWLLDPTSSYLIRFFPIDIFKEITVIWVFFVLTIYIISRNKISTSEL